MLSRLHQTHVHSLRQECRQFAPLPVVGVGDADNVVAVVAPTATVKTPPLRRRGWRDDNYDPRMRQSPKDVLS